MIAGRLLLTASLGLAVVSCGAEQQPEASNAAANLTNEASRLEPVPPENQAAAAPAAGGCGAAMVPQLDRESILAALDKPTPSAATLDAFKARAGTAFKQAAAALCKKGKLAPGLLKSFTTIIIQNGGGADNTAVYEDPHEFRSEDLIFQWTFAESGLQVPDQADIEMGISCWNDPDQPVCAEREP